MILAIDTATRHASIALYDDAGVVAEQSWRSANNHSVELMPTIVQMLDRQRLALQEIDAVAVTQGPGSFTGLRIGMSVAKGICLGLDIPLVAIPTLDVVVYAAGDPGGPVWAVVEAGRGRIGIARYRFEQGLPIREIDLEVVRVETWQPSIKEPVLVTGEVNADLAERLLAHPEADKIAIVSLAGSLRRAGYLAELAANRLDEGRVDDLDHIEPLYFFTASPETS